MRTRPTTRTLLRPAAVALLATLPFVACSGTDDPGSEDVASLGAATGDTTVADDEGGGGGAPRGDGNVAFQDAAVEFAECMREHGIDMPDPEMTEGGGVISVGPAPGSGGAPSAADREEMEAAQEACQPIMDAAVDEMPPLDPEVEEEMRRNALEFAECMRAEGIDFPDPQFGDGGRVEIGFAGGGDDGQRGEIDFEDDDFRAASEACGGEGGFMMPAGSAAVDE